jgi:DNA-binding transcriptional regulator LsrR (DeoR family)
MTRRAKRQGWDNVGPQMQTADSLDLGNMSKLYEILVHDGLENEFAGELLGLMLNAKGTQIPEIKGKTRESFFQIDLQSLRNTTYHGGQVWVIASGDYKAKAIHNVVNNHLANALVIDSDIATKLLEF